MFPVLILQIDILTNTYRLCHTSITSWGSVSESSTKYISVRASCAKTVGLTTLRRYRNRNILIQHFYTCRERISFLIEGLYTPLNVLQIVDLFLIDSYFAGRAWCINIKESKDYKCQDNT